jgi:hypothetical protein
MAADKGNGTAVLKQRVGSVVVGTTTTPHVDKPNKLGAWHVPTECWQESARGTRFVAYFQFEYYGQWVENCYGTASWTVPAKAIRRNIAISGQRA